MKLKTHDHALSGEQFTGCHIVVGSGSPGKTVGIYLLQIVDSNLKKLFGGFCALAILGGDGHGAARTVAQ